MNQANRTGTNGATGIGRRQWLMGAAAIRAVQVTSSAAPGRMTVRAFEPGGAPCDARFLQTLMFTDRAGRPYESVPQLGEAGTAAMAVPTGRFELTMLLPVRDFGTVYLFADAGGELYPPAGRELLLNYEFARSRAAFVRRYAKAAQAAGVSFSPQLLSRLEKGEAALKRATEVRDPAVRARHADESLTETMWAGEMAALERARHRIGGQGLRPGFLFGAYTFLVRSLPPSKTEEHFRLFRNLFNAATVPLYRRGTDTPYFRPGVEREEGKPDYSLAMATVEHLAGTSMNLKGHPLMWFGAPGVPEFLRAKSWEEVKRSCRDHILRTVEKFRSRIHAWDVINEAHGTANELKYDNAQLLELTRFAAETTRVADPTAFRIVNANAPWAEYVQKQRAPDGAKSRTPLEYFAAIEDARIPYEAVGLQFYNPRRDMLEIERQMERFFVFRKPVWITELGISASSELDDRSSRPPSPDVWHGTRWNEQIQADWVEQYYTICYSKPEIEAVSYWNFLDPALYPNAGLVTAEMRPREAYHRLLKLIKSWRES